MGKLSKVVPVRVCLPKYRHGDRDGAAERGGLARGTALTSKKSRAPKFTETPAA